MENTTKNIIDLSRPREKTVWRSKWWVGVLPGPDVQKPQVFERYHTYKKPVKVGEIKGKLNKRFAKRQKVKAWKAAA